MDGDGDVCDNDDDMHGAVTGIDDAVPQLSPGEESRARDEARGRGTKF